MGGLLNRVDVLLVNPTRVGKDSYCTPPLHLMYLEKALNDNGYTTRILNVHEAFCRKAGVVRNAEGLLAEKKDIEDRAVQEILACDVRLIGIGGICSSYEFVERVAKEVKLQKPTPIIIGASLGLPLKELWAKHTQVDYLCEADGERMIVELMNVLDQQDKIQKIPGLYWRDGDGWKGNRPDLPRDLDYIALPDLRKVDHVFYMEIARQFINATLPRDLQLGSHEKVWPVVLTRGCVYDCLFCFHFNRSHRRHSVEYILKMLKHLKETFGVTVVMTWDDLIMADPKWFMELCDRIAESRLGIKFFTSGGKPDIITPVMAKKMAAANFFRISFGIESGSPTILKEMRKQATVEDNENAIAAAVGAGIFVHMNIVLGMPSETRETLQETYNFLRRMVKAHHLTNHNISMAFATAYPGSPLFEIVMKKGLVGDLREYILEVKGVMDPNPVLCQLTPTDLKEFVIKVIGMANDHEFARKKLYGKLFLNRLIYNPVSRAIGGGFPSSVKEMVRGWLR